MIKPDQLLKIKWLLTIMIEAFSLIWLYVFDPQSVLPHAAQLRFILDLYLYALIAKNYRSEGSQLYPTTLGP